jgi:hypothetical protein
MASSKLTEQIITDLLCCSKCIPKESERSEDRTGIWHLTMCTLLSSQGSDAPKLSRLGRRFRQLPYPTICEQPVKSTGRARGRGLILRFRSAVFKRPVSSECGSMSRLMPVSSSAFRTCGVTSKNITGMFPRGQIPVNARACRAAHARNRAGVS